MIVKKSSSWLNLGLCNKTLLRHILWLWALKGCRSCLLNQRLWSLAFRFPVVVFDGLGWGVSNSAGLERASCIV